MENNNKVAETKTRKKANMVWSFIVPLLGMIFIFLIAAAFNLWLGITLAGIFAAVYIIVLRTYDNQTGNARFDPVISFAAILLAIVIGVTGISSGILQIGVINVNEAGSITIGKSDKTSIDEAGDVDIKSARTVNVYNGEEGGLGSLNIFGGVNSMNVDEVDDVNIQSAENVAITSAASVSVGKVDDMHIDEAENVTINEAENVTIEEAENVTIKEADTVIIETTKSTTTKSTTKSTTTTTTTTTKAETTAPVVTTPSNEDTTQPAHTHSWSGWKTNETSHWKECSCGQQDSYGSHNFREDSRVDATCTSDGYVTYKCGTCGYTKTDTIRATGHNMDYGKVTREATCTQDGVKTYTCTKCGHTETEVIRSTGHDMGASIVTREATCEQAGEKTSTCSKCEYKETATIPAKGHSYGTSYNHNDSMHWHECTVCGKKCDEASHSWDAGSVTTQPTETSTGVKTYRCSACGATKTEVVPMLEKQNGKITLKFGQNNYSAGDTVTVTIAFTKVDSLRNLKVKVNGVEVKVSESDIVFRGSGFIILNINDMAGYTGSVSIEVSADGVDSAKDYIHIEQ